MRTHDSESRATMRQKTDSLSESCARTGSSVWKQVRDAAHGYSALAEPDGTVAPSGAQWRAARTFSVEPDTRRVDKAAIYALVTTRRVVPQCVEPRRWALVVEPVEAADNGPAATRGRPGTNSSTGRHMDKLLIALRRGGRDPHGVVVFAAGLMLVYGIGNFALPSLLFAVDTFSDQLVSLLAGGFYGLTAAEISCLGIWAVFGDGPGLARIFLATLAACTLFFCGGLPLADDVSLSSQELLKVGFAALPPLVILGPWPLWILRAGWRWRITWSRSGRQARGSLSIAGLMTTITLVAIALAWVQAGVKQGVLHPIAMLIVGIVVALILVLNALPAVLLIFWIRRYFLGWLIANMVALVFVLTLSTACLLAYEFTRRPVSDEMIGQLLWGCFGFGLAYALLGNTPLLLARLMGARWTRGRGSG